MVSGRLQILAALLLVAIFGLGIYMVRLKRVAERPQSAADARPIKPPVAGPTAPVTLYVADDDDGALHKREVTIALPADPSQRAREILHALIAESVSKPAGHQFASEAEVNEVYFVNGSLAVVDTNAAFADGHPSGILVEQLTLASMAQTLAANFPSVNRMKLLIDGKERDTLAGHADIKDVYDIGAISRTTKEPQ
ncbi:MAG: GerMN domain-containing protein [Terriglobales bacterium]